MQGKTCCVTGHRDIPEEQIDNVKQSLEREVDRAIRDGFTSFLSGFAEGTDLLFAEIVAERIAENPALQLRAAIPYSDWRRSKKRNGRKSCLISAPKFMSLLKHTTPACMPNETAAWSSGLNG